MSPNVRLRETGVPARRQVEEPLLAMLGNTTINRSVDSRPFVRLMVYMCPCPIIYPVDSKARAQKGTLKSEQGDINGYAPSPESRPPHRGVGPARRESVRVRPAIVPAAVEARPKRPAPLLPWIPSAYPIDGNLLRCLVGRCYVVLGVARGRLGGESGRPDVGVRRVALRAGDGLACSSGSSAARFTNFVGGLSGGLISCDEQLDEAGV